MRMLVTGKTGQLATALLECSGTAGVEVMTLGRPEFDLASASTPDTLFAALQPEIIVSAAAYTAVDKAETDALTAQAVNARGPALVATAAARLGIPIIHISTDYVFDGSKPTPYVETDPTGPLGVYGQTKLVGELAVAAAAPDHVILRTAWIYSPFGSNFLKTMLRLAADRPELRVVNDQYGNPTSALEVAQAIFAVARNLLARPEDTSLRGTFHMSGSGEASWADFATEIFAVSQALGGPSAHVTRIGTADYPTPARRPANSRLATAKLREVHGIVMPDWTSSTRDTVSRLVAGQAARSSLQQPM